MIYLVLKEVQKNTDKLVKDYEDLKESLTFQGKQVEELEVINENKILKTQVDDMTESLGICNMEIQNVLTKFEGLEDKNDDLEMHTRKYNLEIQGIPVTKEEDLEEIVIKVAESVGVDMDDDDIDIVHRLPYKSKPIIVRFMSHKVKRRLYLARKKLKGRTSFGPTLNGAQAVYINENLTATRRRLFGEVRKRVKLNKWYNAWSMDGKIFVTKDKGDRPTKISKETDLDDLY